MSYHHNGGFGNGGGFGRSGFRSNGYSNQNGYGGQGAYGSNSNGGFHQNGPRINETQVPQSKHTIFIRGLSGDITTEEIQDFIGQKVGKISFDFVKLAQDRSKIFVAVRFEKRDEAKEFMETYSNREFMGCRCELSWFRDIRRYCAYQRAKQIRSNSQRRRRRSDSDDDNDRRSASPAVRKSTSRASRSRSRSPTKKTRRSESRSASRSPSKSRSPEGRKGRSYRREASSRSGSSEGSVSSRESRRSRKSESSSGEEAESRTSSRVSRRSSRKSSRRSSRPSSRQSSNNQKRRRESESEPKESPKKKAKEVPKIPLPPKEAPPTPQAPPTPVVESPPTNPYQEYQQQIQIQQVTYTVPMEEEAPPRVLVREEVVEQTSYTTPAPPVPPAPPTPTAPTALPPTPLTPLAPKSPSPVTPATLPAFVPRQVGRIEIVMPASLPAVALPQAPPTFAPTAPTQLQGVSPAAALSANSPSKMAAMPSGTPSSDSADTAKFPATNKLFGHLKAFQSALLSTVRYEPPAKNNEDEVSTLRLSSMEATDDSNEELKALEREQKLARLNEDQMMRFHIKKKQLETNFRNDCDTYAVVTRALLSKDESLQFGLKIALLENMDDLYTKMMQRVDEHLNSILA